MLVTEGGGYALRPPADSLDAHASRRSSGAAARSPRAASRDEAARPCDKALALWRGPALADVAGERFAQPEIGGWRTLRLLPGRPHRRGPGLRPRRRARRASSRRSCAAPAARAPARPPYARALPRRAPGGRARRLPRRAYQALVDGLGIEPSPELRALEAAILRHDVPGAGARRAALRARVTAACHLRGLALAPRAPALDPESLRAVVDRFQRAAAAPCSATRRQRRGAARRRAVVLVFGIPVAHEDDAQRALRAAAELRGERRLGVAPAPARGEVVAPAG